MTATPRLLMVGIGSPHGDDAIGWQVADAVAASVCEAGWPDVAVRKAAVPLDVLDWLEGVDLLHLCDAGACSERPVGAIRRFELTAAADGGLDVLPETLRAGGSHDFGLAAVLNLAGTLGRAGGIVVHAVNGRRFGSADSMSAEVRAARSGVVQTILRELQYARGVAGAIAAEPG